MDIESQNFTKALPSCKSSVACHLLFLNVSRPVIIEVPHFASLRGREREITILRSDNGETWKEHSLEASEEAVQEVLNDSFDGEGMSFISFMKKEKFHR